MKVLLFENIMQYFIIWNSKYFQHFSELERLRQIEKKWLDLQTHKDARNESGQGMCSDQSNPSSSQDSSAQKDQRVIVSPDKVILDVPSSRLFDEKSILSKVQKRYHVRAKRLVKHLKNYPDKFSVDENGIISINGKIQPCMDISECLSETFYHNKTLNIPQFQNWTELLKSMNLESYISNPKYKKEEEASLPSAWYFLGEISDEGLFTSGTIE